VTEPAAHAIHIMERAREGLDRFEVWIDTDDGACGDGLCVGMGRTREKALSDAVEYFDQLIQELRGMGGK
jgi:hypothetical protein